MLQQRSKLAVQRPERPLLAPGWLLLLIGSLVVVALIMIYPQQNLIRRVEKAPASELSSAYVTNLLRNDPDNPRLRILLASQALASNDLAALPETLMPALNADDPALRREAQWLLWQGNELRHRQHPDNANRENLARQLAAFADEDWPTGRLVLLAERAYAFGESGIGGELFRRAAANAETPGEAAERYAEGGKIALAHGDYRGAADLQLLARSMVSDPALARAHLLAAIRTLQSGNLPREALDLAEREAAALGDDPKTLFFLTNLARAAGRPDIADRHVRKLLRLSLLRQLERINLAATHDGALPQKVSLRGTGPQLAFDDKTYTLGYDVFLENRKLDDAWKVAVSAVRQSPDDPAWRERLARVAEWTGRPEEALAQWLHLARQTQRDDAWQAVLRLAPGLFDDRALVGALQYQLARQSGDTRLLGELVAAWERLGEPQRALDYLQRLTHRNAAASVLEMQADLAERAGNWQLALHTWQKLFDSPAEATAPRVLRAATLAVQHDRRAEALAWLERARQHPTVAIQARDLLRLSGELAALAQNDEQAIAAFTALIQNPHAEATDYDALIRLLEDDRPAEAASPTTPGNASVRSPIF